MNNLKLCKNFCVQGASGRRLAGQTPCVAFRLYSDEKIQFIDRTDAGSLKRGRGGRSSFSGVVATVFGATGFVGRSLCNMLGKCGTQLIIPYRGDFYSARHLKVLGDLGQIYFLPYHICDEEAIRTAVKHSNVVINLVGRDYETRNFNFEQVNVDAARRIARISKEMGVEKLIHLSALNSNMSHKGYYRPGGSAFLRTKGIGEIAVREEFPDVTIFRPSDVWGQQDRFMFYFSKMFRYMLRTMFLPYDGKNIWKQPVYVGDLANGIVKAVYDYESAGKIYEALGPRRYELCELIDYFNRVLKRDYIWGYRRMDLKWNPLVKLRAELNEKYSWSRPVGNLTIDKIEREAVTDTSFELPNLEDLGIALTSIESRIVWELDILRNRSYVPLEVSEMEKIPKPIYFDPDDYKFVHPTDHAV